MDASRRKAFLKEYNEVCNNFQILTDIRFKLLAFLPIAAAAAAAILSTDRATVPGLALSLFGLVVTLILVTYNTRSDHPYNELVGIASTLERNLGLLDGGFANRPVAWLVVRFWGEKWKVDHGIGVGTIYRASAALWLFGVFASILELVVWFIWTSGSGFHQTSPTETPRSGRTLRRSDSRFSQRMVPTGWSNLRENVENAK